MKHHRNVRRRGNRVSVRVGRSVDRTASGRELAGNVTYSLLVSRDGGQTFGLVRNRRPRPFTASVALRGRRQNAIVSTACDGNGNCGIKRLGRFRAR